MIDSSMDGTVDIKRTYLDENGATRFVGSEYALSSVKGSSGVHILGSEPTVTCQRRAMVYRSTACGAIARTHGRQGGRGVIGLIGTGRM